MATGEWPHAVIDADRHKRVVGVTVCHDGHRQLDPPEPVIPKQVQHHLLYCTDGGAREGYVSTTASCLGSQRAISEPKSHNPLAPSTLPRQGSSRRGCPAKERTRRQVDWP